MPFTEAHFENAILEIFRDQLGYEYLYGPDVERDYTEPLCLDMLAEALVRLNPGLPQQAIDEAIAHIRNHESGSLEQQNARFTDMLQNGVTVNYFDGSEQRSALVRLIDYDLPMHNRFTVANQWSVKEHSVRRADIVVFVNGLPLVVVELKSPSREDTDASEAYAQLRNYMQEIPSLFVYNAFCIISDLATTKAGTITAGKDRFMEWKTVDGTREETRYANFDVLFRGMFEKSRFIELLGGFICCSEKDGKQVKILSAYHQFYAVRKAVESVAKAATTDGRGGVFWHTQGSGKSLSMVFFAKRIQQTMTSPTIVVLTDRNYGDPNIATTAYQEFLKKLEVCRDLLHGYDYTGFRGDSDLERARTISGGADFLQAPEKAEAKKSFIKESLLLRQALSLCQSLLNSEQRLESAYFEAVRTLLTRIEGSGKISLHEINRRINELLKQSIQSEGVINLFSDVQEGFSLFNPKFLEEIGRMKEKNLAVELLRKLIAEQVQLYRRTNTTRASKFSEILSQAMSNYLKGMLTNEEVIEQLLKIAREIIEGEKAGKTLHLTTEELAFYDALTKPEAVRDFYTNDQLLAITHELTDALRKNKSIDWYLKESARAGMRRLVKRLLKKYKYPPEGQEDALNTIMEQCEMWVDNE